MKGRDLDARLEENTNVFLYFFLEQIRENMTRVKTGRYLYRREKRRR